MARLRTSTESSLTSIHHDNTGNPPFPPNSTCPLLLFRQYLLFFNHTRLDVTLGVPEDLVADRPEQAVTVRLHVDYAQPLLMHGLFEQSIGRSLAVFAVLNVAPHHIVSVSGRGRPSSLLRGTRGRGRWYLDLLLTNAAAIVALNAFVFIWD